MSSATALIVPMAPNAARCSVILTRSRLEQPVPVVAHGRLLALGVEAVRKHGAVVADEGGYSQRL